MFTKDSSFEENEAALSKLTKVQCVHFSVHVAKSVLHVWEEQFPDDDRPRKAIEAAEYWLIGQDTAAASYSARDAAYSAASDAYFAAAAAAARAASAAAWTAAYAAWTAAGAAAHAAANSDADADVAWAAYWAADAVGGKWEWISKLYSSIYKEQTFPNYWKTRDTISIAKDMLASRNLKDMPILADALEDAGCTDHEILSHLRNDKDLWTSVDWVLVNLGG